ncbi:MAG: SpoIIE family protein phosphatase [Candidatus Ozemobacteraceae bacterium]
MARLLDRILPGSTAEILGKRFANLLLRRFRGGNPDASMVEAARQRLGRRFGSQQAFQIVLLNASETVLFASPASPKYSALQRRFRQQLDGTWLHEFGLRPPPVRSDRLRAFPHYLAVWKCDASVKQGVSQVIVILDLRRVTLDRIVRYSVERLRSRGWNVGLFDRLKPGQSSLPKSISMEEAGLRFSRGYQGCDESIQRDREILVLAPRLGTLVFMGVQPREAVVFPGWLLGLLIFWLIPTIAFGWGGSQLPGLSLFLAGTLGVAAGIPLLMTLVFWFVFEANRVENVTAELLKSMEGDLIETENRFLPFVRKRRALYLGLIRELETALMNGSPEALSRVKDRMGRLELRAFFDHLWIIDGKGTHSRDYSTLNPAFRILIGFDPETRRRRLQELVDRGYPLDRRDARVTLGLNLDLSSLPLFWSLKISQDVTKKILDGVGAVGRELLHRVNQRSGSGVSGKTGEDASSLVSGSLLESQTGDLMQKIVSTVGQFIRAGSGQVQSRALLDIVHNSEGVGSYCVFIFTDMRTFENGFFRWLMGSRAAWPEGESYSAESEFSLSIFPETRPRRAFRFLDDVLSPPRRLYSWLGKMNGKETLIAGLAGRHVVNYLLVATRSPSEIVERQRELRERALLIGIFMGILIFVIILRLRSTVIVPAILLMGGIRAMERKDFQHRIPLATGDEWDEIARAFNHTLEGMEELEVTRVLRTRLLPAGPIQGAGGVFVGKSLTTGEVGGDYYDALTRPDGGLAFIVGDAPGNGVSAALVTAMVKSAFFTLVRAGTKSPGELLDRLNRLLLCQLSKRQSMSCVAGFVDKNGRITLSGAGFSDPRIMREGHAPNLIHLGGNPLGMLGESVFPNQEVPMSEGGLLVFFTAGVIEARNPEEDEFGMRRLDEVLRDSREHSAERVIDAVQGAWSRHTVTGLWRDDATLAVFAIETSRS